ncbi:formylglycine-generating enzyme family protein [Terracidiphilus sp.]|uniref:formylglycine-generating enzyme family protein n=1 Tax=Terracidiphilus sp. TaxID=1964191 RepID=UPI003C18DAF3
MKITSIALQSAVAFGLLAAFSAAQDTAFAPRGQQIPPPTCLDTRDAWQGRFASCTQANYRDWLADITHWRTERRIRVGYSAERYDFPALKWAQSAFLQPQMMVHDRYFYDPTAGAYTVDRYLDDLNRRYGGIDAVLVWATYPNMGIDDRNQLDMIRSMPGGVEGVRKMVADFHHRGVKVLFPMMMWDQGTHDPGEPWPDAIAALMKEIDADGINGDTQDGVPLAFPLAAEKINHPLAFEPEGGPNDEELAWNVLTWGQYSFQFVPTVDRYRWLEPRHQVNIQDRWGRDKTDDLQFAFFNGEGWESWENVWGVWNGITPRAAEATRRVSAIERAVAPFLVSSDWQPFYPMLHYGVYSSRWPLGNQAVWTIVNRNEYNVSGPQTIVAADPGTRYFDLYHGVELTPIHRGSESVLEFSIEAQGYGAVFAIHGEPDARLIDSMAKMARMTSKPLSSYSNQWTQLPQQLIEIPTTTTVSSAPSGMVQVPSGSFDFKVEGIEIEGADAIGVDVQYPWEDSPRRFHEHPMQIHSFYMDKYPVTNAEFRKFLDVSHYHPKDDLNFLKDWKNGTYPEGAANKPVTWVSLEDARAYALWAGKRLPHEWEWQYAAQGSDGRLYPWGNCNWQSHQPTEQISSCASGADALSTLAPLSDHGRVMLPANDVDAHPSGASPFGVMDMVGNVWQWTDEYTDDHTRAAILRGGSHYHPLGSIWYFPQAYLNSQHSKLLLMAPSYDRSGAIGFRCVKDTEEAMR